MKTSEVYGYLDALISVGYEIQKAYIGQLKITGKFDEKWELSIATRNDQIILNTIFNKIINTISNENKENILSKWISINYQKELDYTKFYKILALILIIIFVLAIIYRQFLLNKVNKELEEKVKEEIEKNNQQHKVLRQQTKKVAMGEMLENIAHQWRQPLSVISVAATGIKMKKEYGILDEKELLESIESINNSAQFLSKTIDDFRNFYSDHKVTSDFYIDETIDKTLKLFGIQFNEYNISIIKDIKKIKINSIENELIQVLINILNNSRDAFEESEKKRLIFIDVYEEDNYLVIKIKDNAKGISEDILYKIFEPYFTTKHKSQGTGIGLYMSEQIITKHMNGLLEVSNQEFVYDNTNYIGAQFLIKLPIRL